MEKARSSVNKTEKILIREMTSTAKLKKNLFEGTQNEMALCCVRKKKAELK